MPAVQTSYSERMPVAVAGMVHNMRDWDAITRSCETAAGIGFGLAVGKGSADGGCVLAGALTVFRGVSVRDVTLVHALASLDEYSETENVAILTRGEIWVQVTGTPTPGDAVHYNASTGVFATSSGSGPVRGARWMATGLSTGIARLYLSGDGQAAA